MVTALRSFAWDLVSVTAGDCVRVWDRNRRTGILRRGGLSHPDQRFRAAARDYRRYVDQETSCATLRRDLWLAGNYVRDFFIRNTPEQAGTLHAQLESLKHEADDALDHLTGVSTQQDMVPELRKSLGEFLGSRRPASPSACWSIGDALAVSPAGDRASPRRVVQCPARSHFSRQQFLQESEGEFATARQHAASGSLGMLA